MSFPFSPSWRSPQPYHTLFMVVMALFAVLSRSMSAPLSSLMMDLVAPGAARLVHTILPFSRSFTDVGRNVAQVDGAVVRRNSAVPAVSLGSVNVVLGRLLKMVHRHFQALP